MATVEEFQVAAEEAFLAWPNVRAKQVFGHRGFVRGTKMFAFFAEDGLGVKVPSEDERAALYTRPGVRPFAYSGMEMKQWPVLPLASDDDLAEALSAARKAYEDVA